MGITRVAASRQPENWGISRSHCRCPCCFFTASPTVLPPVIMLKPNPRSCGSSVPVFTLCRAPISSSLPTESDPAPLAVPSPQLKCNCHTRARAHAHSAARAEYPPPTQLELKYDVKSARVGRGGWVTAVAVIRAEASKPAGSSAGPRPCRLKLQ